jgi:hypothetical protein
VELAVAAKVAASDGATVSAGVAKVNEVSAAKVAASDGASVSAGVAEAEKVPAIVLAEVSALVGATV